MDWIITGIPPELGDGMDGSEGRDVRLQAEELADGGQLFADREVKQL
jgi:hypothetical protein